MKRFALFCIASIFVLSAAVFAEPVTLEYKFKPGDVDKYRMKMDMSMQIPSMPSLPSMNITTTMNCIQKTLAVNPDGSAKIKVAYEDVKINGLPDAAKNSTNKKTKALTGQSITATMSKRGQMLSVDGMDKLMAASGVQNMDMSKFLNAASNHALLPEGPVEIGQSWTQDVSLPFGESKINVISTLESTDQQIWSLNAAKVNQKFDGSFDIGAIINAVMGSINMGAKASPDMSSFSGTANLSGDMGFLFAPSIGKLLKGEGDMQMKMVMNMPAEAVKNGAPTSIEMNMNMRINITRYK